MTTQKVYSPPDKILRIAGRPWTIIDGEAEIKPGDVLRISYYVDANDIFDQAKGRTIVLNLLNEEERGELELIQVNYEPDTHRLIVVAKILRPRSVAAAVALGIVAVAVGTILLLALQKVERMSAFELPNPFGENARFSIAPLLVIGGVILAIGGGIKLAGRGVQAAKTPLPIDAGS